MNELLTNKTRYSDNQITLNTGSNNNMTTLAYLIPVGKIIQDRISGKFSFIDVFDVVNIPPKSNFIYQTFFIAGKITDIKTGRHKIKISIIDPDEEELASVNFPEVDLIIGDVPLSAFFGLVKVEKEGKHYLKAFVDDIELKSHSKFYFDVRKGVANGAANK